MHVRWKCYRVACKKSHFLDHPIRYSTTENLRVQITLKSKIQNGQTLYEVTLNCVQKLRFVWVLTILGPRLGALYGPLGSTDGSDSDFGRSPIARNFGQGRVLRSCVSNWMVRAETRILRCFCRFVAYPLGPRREKFEKNRKTWFFCVSRCWKCILMFGTGKPDQTLTKWRWDPPKSTLADRMAPILSWFVRM